MISGLNCLLFGSARNPGVQTVTLPLNSYPMPADILKTQMYGKRRVTIA